MRSLVAAAVLMATASPALAQAVGDRRFDPVTGDYYVMVMNDSLRLQEMWVVPPNKVRVSLGVTVAPGELRPFRYVYTAKVLRNTRQQLAYLEIDCPASAVIEKLTVASVRNGVSNRASASRVEHGERPRCEITHYPALGVGGTLEVGLETTLLPTIGEVRAFGDIEGGDAGWPTSDPIEENVPATFVVHEVDGIDGGWKSLPAPVPGRDPATMTDLATGLAVLQNDLDRACGDLAWITRAEVCMSLRNRLQQATPPVTRGNNVKARVRLESFLVELAAQHDPSRGRPVNDAAYWLLKVNAEFVLGLISGPGR